MKPDEIQMPENLDAERFLLGACLTDPEEFTQIRVALNPEDFAIEPHRRIFTAMAELSDQGSAIDRLTVGNALANKGQLAAVGGYGFLHTLDEGMPKLANSAAYCKIVQDKSTARKVIGAARQLIERCSTGEESAESLLTSAASDLLGITGTNRGEPLQPSADVVLDSGGIDAFFKNEHIGIRTPFAGINFTIGGFKPDQLFVLAARPSVGKSALALQFATHAAFNGKRTVMYSLEMSSQSLLRRAVAALSGVSGMRARSGDVSPAERNLLHQALTEFIELGDKLQFSQKAHVNAMAIRADLQRLSAMGKPAQLVVVDYLQLMGAMGRHENRVQEVSQISRGLKVIAKEFNIPVLALSQLSRAIETRGDGRPVLSDLRESGSIEQDADSVMFLWPQNRESSDPEMRVINWEVAKQREGPTTGGTLNFRRTLTRFEEEAVNPPREIYA